MNNLYKIEYHPKENGNPTTVFVSAIDKKSAVNISWIGNPDVIICEYICKIDDIVVNGRK
jgi:hypothetical protein